MVDDGPVEKNGQVAYRDYPGVTHECFGMGGVVEQAKQANDAVITDQKGAFACTATGWAAPK